ncbi:MAG: hypothetical protein GY727_07495 [Gammaproteobacteria bacterium]|nr:hypothetical protein [Gammaproteobacteria bacterium]MCP4091717.1 hypothetical protein [Gammaproteobacteria bacterium]MCP4275024.1 hypothetical protein [Gammaproteobacteria bacterium]MCP4831847.1 hypothetical protein [Gammaproteobacteria bacterium]MCP4929783.1 hypothetical protein [Gammaproteobacteria bacterium]
MGRFIKLNAVLCMVAVMWFLPATAEDELILPQQDCDAILSSYAVTPKAVPAELVETCLNSINVAPAAGMAASLAADPCSGPGAGGSVYCWGPWSVLAPAAGPVGPALASSLYEEDPSPELLGIVPEIEPILELPLGGCDPGAPCGFATAVSNVSGVDEGAETSLQRFTMLDDGTSFTVAPGAANEIQSVTGMTTHYFSLPDGTEILDAVGVESGQASQLQARVVRPDDTVIVYSAAYWANVDIDSGIANSGGFAWGNASTQADIDSLNNIGGGISLGFAGMMSVDPTTQANLVLNFGAVQTWSGNWVNPSYSFSAGGVMSGADFVSNLDQFSDNVQSGYVQGALLGPLGDQAVTHAVNVSLDDIGIVRDVGLALQQLP